MNYIAVDDEPFALRDLQEALTEAAPDCALAFFTLPGKALSFAESTPVDVAFLDIELGSMSGLVLAKQLKELRPEVHIVFVTSYEQYAVKAFELHATGYLMKPVTASDIRRELTFIYGEPSLLKRVRVQTFGGFEVFVDGRPLLFHRAKAKELLAFLIDRRGASVTNDAICIALWEDDAITDASKGYLRVLLTELRSTLKQAGAVNILEKSFNRLAINPELIDCDFYRFLEGDPVAVNSYRYDYLPEYSWAEFSVSALDKQLK